MCHLDYSNSEEAIKIVNLFIFLTVMIGIPFVELNANVYVNKFSLNSSTYLIKLSDVKYH